jgi:predicted DNA-binding transcriptional regulator AlpA
MSETERDQMGNGEQTGGGLVRPIPGRQYLNEDEVAQRLQISPRTLQAWRRRGVGPPFVQIGRLVRYEATRLQEWCDAQRVNQEGKLAKPARPARPVVNGRKSQRSRRTERRVAKLQLVMGAAKPAGEADAGEARRMGERTDGRPDVLWAIWRYELERQMAWVRAWRPANWQELEARLEQVKREAAERPLAACWLAVQEIGVALDRELGLWSAERERAWRAVQQAGGELANDEWRLLRCVWQKYPLASAMRDLWPASETQERLAKVCAKIGVEIGDGQEVERRLRAAAERLFGADKES